MKKKIAKEWYQEKKNKRFSSLNIINVNPTEIFIWNGFGQMRQNWAFQHKVLEDGL